MSDQFDNVSSELRRFDHWINWRGENHGTEKLVKVPYSAISGQKADVTNYNHWTSFDRAVKFCRTYGTSGIGFVFNDLNDVSGIDLDRTDDAVISARQIDIYKQFDSYSEVSPNGGLHIFVKGKITGPGRRSGTIELYSRDRFFTVTGNVFNHNPIFDRSLLLATLYEQLGSDKTIHVDSDVSLIEREATQEDREIIAQCFNAVNGPKFASLYNGDWQQYYPSQSEADFALIDIVCFYSKNRDQIKRIFMLSQLGQRSKAKRADYVDKMISRSFDRTVAPVTIIGLETALADKIRMNGASPFPPKEPTIDTNVQYAAPETLPTEEPPTEPHLAKPDGLMGDIAEFIYQASPRPVLELSLCAAITLMAGICGRAWNVSGTGLNHYTLLLANTGVGKEAMASGISKIMYHVSQVNPSIREFVGPSELPSGVGIIKALAKKPSCYSILGEFGYRIQQLTSQKANPAEVGLRRTILDLYNKSGFGQTIEPSAYSDTSKNYDTIFSPAWSFLGESVPSKFYNALDESMLADGFLPRCTIIEYTGLRPDLNEAHVNVIPSFELIARISTLVEYSHRVAVAKAVVNVKIDPETIEELRVYDRQSTAYINSAQEDIIRELWNRAHIKVMRLAALIAVGIDHANPIITTKLLHWAMNVVNTDIQKLSVRFVKGQIGSDNLENQQLFELQKSFRAYVNLPYEKIRPYSSRSDMHRDKVIPLSYLQKRLALNAAFTRDRMGATRALERTLKLMVDTDLIKRLTPFDTAQYGTSMQCYKIHDRSWI